MRYTFKDDDVCRCCCHEKGVRVSHIMPCCDLTYVKYINEDGSIDREAINKALNETNKE